MACRRRSIRFHFLLHSCHCPCSFFSSPTSSSTSSKDSENLSLTPWPLFSDLSRFVHATRNKDKRRKSKVEEEDEEEKARGKSRVKM
jgi:hypothetical protein